MPVTVRDLEVAQVLAREVKAAAARSVQASLRADQVRLLFGARQLDAAERERIQSALEMAGLEPQPSLLEVDPDAPVAFVAGGSQPRQRRFAGRATEPAQPAADTDFPAVGDFARGAFDKARRRFGTHGSDAAVERNGEANGVVHHDPPAERNGEPNGSARGEASAERDDELDAAVERPDSAVRDELAAEPDSDPIPDKMGGEPNRAVRHDHDFDYGPRGAPDEFDFEEGSHEAALADAADAAQADGGEETVAAPAGGESVHEAGGETAAVAREDAVDEADAGAGDDTTDAERADAVEEADVDGVHDATDAALAAGREDAVEEADVDGVHGTTDAALAAGREDAVGEADAGARDEATDAALEGPEASHAEIDTADEGAASVEDEAPDAEPDTHGDSHGAIDGAVAAGDATAAHAALADDASDEAPAAADSVAVADDDVAHQPTAGVAPEVSAPSPASGPISGVGDVEPQRDATTRAEIAAVLIAAATLPVVGTSIAGWRFGLPYLALMIAASGWLVGKARAEEGAGGGVLAAVRSSATATAALKVAAVLTVGSAVAAVLLASASTSRSPSGTPSEAARPGIVSAVTRFAARIPAPAARHRTRTRRHVTATAPPPSQPASGGATSTGAGSSSGARSAAPSAGGSGQGTATPPGSRGTQGLIEVPGH